jgi:uncharacterized protein (TIGR02284 family)
MPLDAFLVQQMRVKAVSVSYPISSLRIGVKTMSTATMNLPKKSVDWLQDLIQINLDSRDGFKEAAENLKENHSSLEVMFRQIANERSAQANELQSVVASNATKPEKSGSVAAAAHRAWMDLRSALGGGEHAILSEAERGEDHIKEKYEKAIHDLGSCSCVPMLRRQYAAVQASHDMVRNLRDRQKPK